MNRISFSWVLALVCLSLSISHAQDEPVKTVKVRFRLYGWDTAATDLNYFQSGKDLGVQVYESLRSPFYDYEGPAVVTFYRLKPGADGKMEKVPAAQANLDGAGPWPLLIFLPVTGNVSDFKVQVLPDDLKSFPAGSFKFANYTKAPISGSLGEQTFALQPEEMKTLLGRASGATTTLFATVYTETTQGKKTVYTNNWAFQPLMRTLVFVRDSTDSSTGVVARRITESAVFPKEKGSSSSQSGDGR